jgi:hypothetical protein
LVSPDAVWNDAGDELVLLNSRTQSFFGLNRVGSDVWRLVASGMGAEEIVDRLCGVYEVARGEATAEVDLLLQQLAEAGLVEL